MREDFDSVLLSGLSLNSRLDSTTCGCWEHLILFRSLSRLSFGLDDLKILGAAGSPRGPGGPEVWEVRTRNLCL